MAISQSEAMPVNTQEPQIEVAAITERFTTGTWCPEDGEPEHYVERIWKKESGPSIYDQIAGPFTTKEQAKAELDRILALKEKAAEPDQYHLEMSRSLRGDNRADQFIVTRTWFDGWTGYISIEAGPFLTKEEAETAFQRLTAQKNEGSSTSQAHISA